MHAFHVNTWVQQVAVEHLQTTNNQKEEEEEEAGGRAADSEQRREYKHFSEPSSHYRE